MPVTLATRDPGFEAAFRRLVEAKRDTAADVDAVVAAIIEDVARDGDQALLEYTRRFDGVELSDRGLRLTHREIAEGAAAAPADTLAALELAAERIENFHRRQLPAEIDYVDGLGVRLAQRWRPIDAVGLYVPGGTAAYPSSVLMNAIPAKVADVRRLVMTVPAPGGVLNPLVLAAARLLGIDEIYRIGGAQAIAGLAYGTATIAPVDKIVGPGNAYVAAAKRRVFGRVGIDMIAGPSEILVVADAGNDPKWIAADLLSQAEHDTAAQAILITDDEGFARAVEAAIECHLTRLPRADIARASWQANGAIITVADWREAPALIDRIAPEHLELALDEADALAARGQACWRDLYRPLGARGDRRLYRRTQSRLAHGAKCALCFRTRRARFYEADIAGALRRSEPRSPRTGGDPAGRGRGTRCACAVTVDPAQSTKLGLSRPDDRTDRRCGGRPAHRRHYS